MAIVVPHTKQEQPPITNCAYQVKISYDTWKCYSQAEYDNYQASKKIQESNTAPYAIGFAVIIVIILWWINRQ